MKVSAGLFCLNRGSTMNWAACLVCLTAICLAVTASASQQEIPPPKVRTYYIAADEVEWDYAPGGVNKMMGMKFDGYSKVFVERGPHRKIGRAHV